MHVCSGCYGSFYEKGELAVPLDLYEPKPSKLKCPDCGIWWAGLEHRCQPAQTTTGTVPPVVISDPKGCTCPRYQPPYTIGDPPPCPVHNPPNTSSVTWGTA